MNGEVVQEVDNRSDLTLLLTQCTKSGYLQCALLREDETTMDEEQKKGFVDMFLCNFIAYNI